MSSQINDCSFFLQGIYANCYIITQNYGKMECRFVYNCKKTSMFCKKNVQNERKVKRNR